jgi:hypothetical protein
VFPEHLIAAHEALIENRRKLRHSTEQRTATGDEWAKFEQHFLLRKVALGDCHRPYGTSCVHEHACIRCHMLSINPKMVPRLDELEEDLLARRKRAIDEGWRGEVEGLELTLTFLRRKREQARRTAEMGTVSLGMPVTPGR